MSVNVIAAKLFLYSKNQFLKNLSSGTQCRGFQSLLILDLLSKNKPETLQV